MKHISTKRVPSKREPDVGYVLKRMNVRRRELLDEIQAPTRAKLRPLQEELAPLTKEYREAYEAAEALVKPQRDKLASEGVSEEDAKRRVPLGDISFPNEKFQKWLTLKEQVNKIDRNELTPAAIAYVLVRIEGLEIEDEKGECAPATLESLLAYGPDELYTELAEEVARELGLLEEEKENLEPRSTSVAVEPEEKTTGNADPAGKPEMIIAVAA